MQLVCKQIVIHTVADESVTDKNEIKSILNYFKSNRAGLDVTVKRDGNTRRFSNVRLLKITDDGLIDFVATDTSYSLTLRKVPFCDFVQVNATIKEPISPDQLEDMSLENIFDFDSDS